VTGPGWTEISRALQGHSALRVEGDTPRAAVSLVLRQGRQDLELLFILRAEHEGDPWSGHVGFPGGRAEPVDSDLVSTAIRETREETGLDLARSGRLLGSLDEVAALARGRPVDLVIAPFAFQLRPPQEGAPSHEVVSLHWIPLGTLLDPATRSTFSYVHEGRTLELPCLRVDGLVIWGLTYRMFDGFRALLDTAPRSGKHSAR
jgi:8-oxo-dGTP pyrophosphatase MutT (NUDIX family)